MNPTIETTNVLIAYDELKDRYLNYKKSLDQFPKLWASHTMHPTKYSPDICNGYRNKLSKELCDLKFKASKFKNLGLESELVEEIITKEYNAS